MGEDHGGTGGTSPSPRIWSGGTLMQIVSTPPPRFCHIGAKMSVLWPLKYAKIRFRSGLCPGSRWESSRRSPRPLSPLERGHPSPYPIPLGTDPPSALAMRPPRSPATSTPMLTNATDRRTDGLIRTNRLYDSKCCASLRCTANKQRKML